MMLENTLHTVVDRKQSFVKDEFLVKAGHDFKKLYVIHSGALKTSITTHEGKEQINGFYLPGDIVGFDGIASQKYSNNISALTNTLVCELDYDELMVLVSKNPPLLKMVLNLLSLDIINYQKLMICYSQKKADERLAAFIYSLYFRYAQRGHSSLNIKLSMSRHDIANFLGLTIETVSRIFTRLQELDILSVKGKYIHIKDINKLTKIANEL